MPRTAAARQKKPAAILLSMCPHNHICVLILLYMCDHTTMHASLRKPTAALLLASVFVHTDGLILLYLCPHTTEYVSAYLQDCWLTDALSAGCSRTSAPRATKTRTRRALTSTAQHGRSCSPFPSRRTAARRTECCCTRHGSYFNSFFMRFFSFIRVF
jgi:hypothetical protein